MANLRHEVSRGTIVNVLKPAGVEPALTRKDGMTWREFLKVHWQVLAATDLFTGEVWTGRGRVRFHVHFVIELATRAVEVSGVIPEPTESLMLQTARNLVEPWTGFLTSSHLFIHGCATMFREHFSSTAAERTG